MSWSEYYDAVEGRPPNPFLARLKPHLGSGGRALDLGAGTGPATRFLVEHGYQVTALDNDPEGLGRLRGKMVGGAHVEIVQAPFWELPPGPYDVIVSLFSLFFCPPKRFDETWQVIEAAVAPGGILAGQLLGPEDTWNNGSLSVHTAEDVDRLFAGWEWLDREEANRDGVTATGREKHWHVHHLIARRVGTGDTPGSSSRGRVQPGGPSSPSARTPGAQPR